MVVVKILKRKFRVYHTNELSKPKKLNFSGIYILVDFSFNPIYVGMTQYHIRERVTHHKRRGIKFDYVLAYKDFFWHRYYCESIGYTIPSKLIHSYYDNSKTIQKKFLQRVERVFIKTLKPKENIQHNG